MILHQQDLSKSGNRFQTQIQKSDSWNTHFHKNYEMLYVISGNIECTINNKTEILREGEFSLCLSNQIHSGRSIGDSIFWACIFSEDLVHSFGKIVADKEGETFKFTCNEAVQKYFEAMFLQGSSPDLFVQKSCLYALCDEYLNQTKLVEKDKTKTSAITEIVDYISANYMNKIHLSDIADLLNYDYHYASRLFKALFNMSFNDFVNVYRLERATELLQTEDKKLIDIAYESGFQSIRSFNECFKNYYGTSPSEYKKRIM